MTAELVRTERLLARTPSDSPERPRLVRRLADGYAELARIAELEKLQAAIRASEAQTRAKVKFLKKKHLPKASRKKKARAPKPRVKK